MGLTPEHKAKMAAGRVRAAEARKAVAKTTVGMAAGHERDEQLRVNADSLQERQEKFSETQGIEAIDPAKLAQRDHETLFRVEESKGGVTNPRPGYRYIRVTLSDAYRDNGAKANIRMMHALAKEHGFEAVRGDDIEDKKYEGNDHTAGTTLRGLADTVLYRQTEEAYQLMQRKMAEKARRQGAIEEQGVVYARSRGVNTMHGVAGDFSQDPLMARVAGDAGRVETFHHQRQPRSTFTTGDLARGSMKGPNGEVLPPGFERLGR